MFNANKLKHFMLPLIVVVGCLVYTSSTAFAQDPKNLEDALKRTGAHDHVDPDYAQPMGQQSAVGVAGTLLKINHASEEQLAAYENFFKENDDRHLNELKELVAIQSLAMAPEHERVGCHPIPGYGAGTCSGCTESG